MNAGGVPNTCKSNEEPMNLFKGFPSGERVSNALVICPEAGDNNPKGLLIPHVIYLVRDGRLKAFVTSGGACVPSASW